MAFLAGYGGAALVGATELQIKEWKLNDTAGIADCTHSGSNARFTPQKIAPLKATVTVNAVWDSAVNIHGTPNVKPGETVDVTLQVGTGSQTYVLDDMMIESVEVTNAVMGTVDYTFTAVGSVTTYPS